MTLAPDQLRELHCLEQAETHWASLRERCEAVRLTAHRQIAVADHNRVVAESGARAVRRRRDEILAAAQRAATPQGKEAR